jgi:hypothetical protein
MGTEPQALKDADRSETAKRLPGSGRSSLALQVPVLAPLLPVPVLPLLAWRRRLAFSVPLFSVPLFSVLPCLVLPSLVLLCLVQLSSVPLFSPQAFWPRPS